MLRWPKALKKFMFEIFRYDGAGLSGGDLHHALQRQRLTLEYLDAGTKESTSSRK